MKSAEGEDTQGLCLLIVGTAEGGVAAGARIGVTVIHHHQGGIAVILVMKNCCQEGLVTAPARGGALHQGSKLNAMAHIMVKPRGGRASDPKFETLGL